jgi:hypothetical protein
MFSSWSLRLMVIGLVSLPISAFAADTELVGAMKSFTGTIGGFIALIICYKGVAAISVAGPKSNSVLEYDTNLWKAF